MAWWMLGAAAMNSDAAKNKWTPVVIGVLVVGGTVLGFFLVKRGLCAIGLATCSYHRRLARLQNRLKENKALDPTYYKAENITITHFFAKEKADELWDALWGADDEDEVYSILRSAKSKDNMSLISKYYTIRHDSSLADNLSYEMGSKEEVQRMLEILQY